MRTRIIAASAAVLTAAALTVPTAALAAPASAAPEAIRSGLSVSGGHDIEEQGLQLAAGLGAQLRTSVTPEGGGSWTYGTNGPNNTVYSNFYHASRWHGSSVKDGDGHLATSPTALGGATAKASIKKTWAGNSAYYRFVN